MSKISLRNIFGKKSEVPGILTTLTSQIGAGIHIKDVNGTTVFGKVPEKESGKYPINFEDEVLGWVEGDEKAATIAELLNLLIKKEDERKKLGTEVLTLYQEVNLIFNFSEKLAQAIEPVAIAQVALEEASHLINFNSGVLILWDQNNQQLQTLARLGALLFNEDNLKTNAGLLLKMGISGNSEIITDTSSLKGAGIIGEEVKSLLYAALKVKHRIMGAIILANTTDEQYAAANLKFLITIALQSSAAIESALLYEKNIREAKEREEIMRHIYEAAGKFVPFEFIRSLGRDVITDVQLGDQVEKVVTVLFTDIRDYTTISEQMTPEENFAFVCSFNEIMGPIIRNNRGFINQYQGDAIMAIFPNSASDALTAAVEMQKAVQALNKKREAENLTTIRMGIGMHTGPLIMGITGDNERMDATTISDAVNTASRIESLTKYYKGNIIISDATLQQIVHPEKFHLRYLGKVQLKGKQAPISIHECFSGNTTEQLEGKEKTLDLFNKGMEQYLNKSFSSAINTFEHIAKINPSDHTAVFFLNKATRYITNGIPENWNGVEEMISK